MLTIHTMFARCEINQDATLRSRSSEAEALKCSFHPKMKSIPVLCFQCQYPRKFGGRQLSTPVESSLCMRLSKPQKSIWNAVQCSCRIVPICLNDHKGLRFRLKLRHLCFSHEASSGKHWQGEMIWECQSKRESKTAAALPEGSA